MEDNQDSTKCTIQYICTNCGYSQPNPPNRIIESTSTPNLIEKTSSPKRLSELKERPTTSLIEEQAKDERVQLISITEPEPANSVLNESKEMSNESCDKTQAISESVQQMSEKVSLHSSVEIPSIYNLIETKLGNMANVTICRNPSFTAPAKPVPSAETAVLVTSTSSTPPLSPFPLPPSQSLLTLPQSTITASPRKEEIQSSDVLIDKSLQISPRSKEIPKPIEQKITTPHVQQLKHKSSFKISQRMTTTSPPLVKQDLEESTSYTVRTSLPPRIKPKPQFKLHTPVTQLSNSIEPPSKIEHSYASGLEDSSQRIRTKVAETPAIKKPQTSLQLRTRKYVSEPPYKQVLSKSSGHIEPEPQMSIHSKMYIKNIFSEPTPKTRELSKSTDFTASPSRYSSQVQRKRLLAPPPLKKEMPSKSSSSGLHTVSPVSDSQVKKKRILVPPPLKKEMPLESTSSGLHTDSQVKKKRILAPPPLKKEIPLESSSSSLCSVSPVYSNVQRKRILAPPSLKKETPSKTGVPVPVSSSLMPKKKMLAPPPTKKQIISELTASLARKPPGEIKIRQNSLNTQITPKPQPNDSRKELNKK